MSRSCQSATFSSEACALARSSRARPQICSQPIGLRLCGIADEPFCPFANGSSTSPISVFWRPRISSANFSSDAAVIASADRVQPGRRDEWISPHYSLAEFIAEEIPDLLCRFTQWCGDEW